MFFRGVDCKYKINYNSSIKNYNKRKRAFTLAEVLITLGIIGVVAALTIPTILRNIQDYQLNIAFKKFYSTFTQAVQGIQTLEGRPVRCFYWDSNPYTDNCTAYCPDINEQTGNCNVDRICQETGKPIPSDYSGPTSECSWFYHQLFDNTLNVLKICENNSMANGCLPSDIRGQDKIRQDFQPDYEPVPYAEFSDNNLKTKYPTIVLKDGTYIIKYVALYDGKPVFVFDINGKKGPNKWGYDIYDVKFAGNYSTGIKIMRAGYLIENGGKNFDERMKAAGLK